MIRSPGGCSRSQASASPTVCSPRSRVTSRRRWRVTGSFRVCSRKAAGMSEKTSGGRKARRSLAYLMTLLALRPRRGGDIDVGVHVRGAPEVPDEGWAFQAPDVPNLVGADVVVLVEGQ